MISLVFILSDIVKEFLTFFEAHSDTPINQNDNPRIRMQSYLSAKILQSWDRHGPLVLVGPKFSDFFWSWSGDRIGDSGDSGRTLKNTNFYAATWS